MKKTNIQIHTQVKLFIQYLFMNNKENKLSNGPSLSVSPLSLTKTTHTNERAHTKSVKWMRADCDVMLQNAC